VSVAAVASLIHCKYKYRKTTKLWKLYPAAACIDCTFLLCNCD